MINNQEQSRAHLPGCTQVCMVVDVFSILVFWIEVITGLQGKNKVSLQIRSQSLR